MKVGGTSSTMNLAGGSACSSCSIYLENLLFVGVKCLFYYLYKRVVWFPFVFVFLFVWLLFFEDYCFCFVVIIFSSSPSFFSLSLFLFSLFFIFGYFFVKKKLLKRFSLFLIY